MEGFVTTSENMGQPKETKRGVVDTTSPTSIRLTESLNERLAATVNTSPLSKNDVLRVLIRLGLSQVEKDSSLLLNEHLSILKEQKAEKELASTTEQTATKKAPATKKPTRKNAKKAN